jgi:hypothetical protein
MTPIPRYGCIEAVLPGCCGEIVVVVESGPRPLAYCTTCGVWNEGYEIDGQPILMRALPTSRFSTPSSEKVILSDWAAVALENLEQGLRAAGLIGSREKCVQSLKAVTRFRVTKLEVDRPDILYSGHRVTSLVTDNARPDVTEPGPVAQAGGLPKPNQSFQICDDCNDPAKCSLGCARAAKPPT